MHLLVALRSGAWLTRGRVRAYARIFLAIEIAAFIFFVLGTHGLIVPMKTPTTTDFVSFYAAGALADAGTSALAYDKVAHFLAEQRAIHAIGFSYNYFFYPPVFLLVCRLLAKLPYLVAFVLFETITGLAYLAAVRAIIGRAGLLTPFLAFPSLLWTIGLGQNAALSAALFGGGTYFVERRPMLAGFLFGCLCYKPHLGLLIPVALLTGRHWRCAGAATATVLTLVGFSVWLEGIDCWRAFLVTAMTTGNTFGVSGVPPTGLVTPFAAMRVLGFRAGIGEAVQAIFTGAALVLVAVYWWKRPVSPPGIYPAQAAILCSATLLAVPVLLFYDWMLAAIAIAWLIRAAASSGYRPWEKLGMALVGAGPVSSRGFAIAFHIPFMPLLSLWLLILSVGRARAVLSPQGP